MMILNSEVLNEVIVLTIMWENDEKQQGRDCASTK